MFVISIILKAIHTTNYLKLNTWDLYWIICRHWDESRNTLVYADRAKNISNKVQSEKITIYKYIHMLNFFCITKSIILFSAIIQKNAFGQSSGLHTNLLFSVFMLNLNHLLVFVLFLSWIQRVKSKYFIKIVMDLTQPHICHKGHVFLTTTVSLSRRTHPSNCVLVPKNTSF